MRGLSVDKNVKILVLVGVGGVAVYLIWKGGYFQKWFPTLFSGTAPAAQPGTQPGAQPRTPVYVPGAAPSLAPAQLQPAVSTIPSAGSFVPAPVSPPITQVAPPVAAPESGGDILTQVATAASNAGQGPLLNMDQWCFYYNQIKGDGSCPDPGAIPAGTYAGAGVLLADGQTPGDRTTPIDINTWWALVTWEQPGLSGLSALSLARLQVMRANPWLT
jgi:hypothetical protein